jgi:PPOX class probable F420-dependent enzyme
VDPQRVRDFARTHHRAVLATTRADGRPQLSPVTVGVDEDGRLVISTRQAAMKARNLAREPHASVCLLNDGFFGEWLQAEGPAEIVRLPEAMDLLVDYYRQTAGEHPDWDDYRDAMRREQRVLIRITITRAGPEASG